MPQTEEPKETPEYLRQVGMRLVHLREVNGMTQEQMAAIIRMDQTAWAKYEKGKRLIKPYVLLSVCARFRVSMDYVYRGTLFGVHQELALELAARDPSLVLNTNRILAGMGRPPLSDRDSKLI